MDGFRSCQSAHQWRLSYHERLTALEKKLGGPHNLAVGDTVNRISHAELVHRQYGMPLTLSRFYVNLCFYNFAPAGSQGRYLIFAKSFDGSLLHRAFHPGGENLCRYHATQPLTFRCNRCGAMVQTAGLCLMLLLRMLALLCLCRCYGAQYRDRDIDVTMPSKHQGMIDKFSLPQRTMPMVPTKITSLTVTSSLDTHVHVKTTRCHGGACSAMAPTARSGWTLTPQ